ncbi:putative E3 ubiquitin-protein ligase HERC4 [Glycine max]|nr:putative E3 ubiquitin-protein ligase HERC4 [Glycine max]
MWRRNFLKLHHLSLRASGKRFVALWGNGDFGRIGSWQLGFAMETRRLPRVPRPNPKGHCLWWCSHPLLNSPQLLIMPVLELINCSPFTDNGCVYATGLNDFGQLGVSESKHYSVEPLCVFGEEKKVVQVSAGYNHSCAITVDGELYMWGKNTSVQLGLGKRAPNIVPLPTKVEYLNGINIKMAALGSDHSLAISDGGEAFSWGVGVSGRLGHGHESSILGFFKSYSEYTPRLIKDLEGIKRLKAMSDATKPSLIGELPSSKVVCGGYHTCVLTNSGELYTWVQMKMAALVLDQGPFLKSSVSQLSCGWKNTAAISEGRVFTWGWGGSNGTFSEVGHSSSGQLLCFCFSNNL